MWEWGLFALDCTAGMTSQAQCWAIVWTWFVIVLSWFVGCLHSFIVWEKGIGDVETEGKLVFTPLSNYPAMGNFTFELVAQSHKRTEHNLLLPGSQEALLLSTLRVLCSQKNAATENYHFSPIPCQWNTRRFPASSALLVIYGFGERTGLSALRQLQANVTLSYVHRVNPGTKRTVTDLWEIRSSAECPPLYS